MSNLEKIDQLLSILNDVRCDYCIDMDAFPSAVIFDCVLYITYLVTFTSNALLADTYFAMTRKRHMYAVCHVILLVAMDQSDIHALIEALSGTMNAKWLCLSDSLFLSSLSPDIRYATDRRHWRLRGMLAWKQLWLNPTPSMQCQNKKEFILKFLLWTFLVPIFFFHKVNVPLWCVFCGSEHNSQQIFKHSMDYAYHFSPPFLRWKKLVEQMLDAETYEAVLEWFGKYLEGKLYLVQQGTE